MCILSKRFHVSILRVHGLICVVFFNYICLSISHIYTSEQLCFIYTHSSTLYAIGPIINPSSHDYEDSGSDSDADQRGSKNFSIEVDGCRSSSRVVDKEERPSGVLLPRLIAFDSLPVAGVHFRNRGPFSVSSRWFYSFGSLLSSVIVLLVVYPVCVIFVVMLMLIIVTDGY